MVIKGLILMIIAFIVIMAISTIHRRLCTRYKRKFEELNNMQNNLKNIQEQLGYVLVNKTNMYSRSIINEDEICDKFKELQMCLFDTGDKLYNINVIRKVSRLDNAANNNKFHYRDDIPYLQQLGDVEVQLAKAFALTRIIGGYLSEA